MATRTISDTGGNWNSTSSWVEGAVPVDGDDVVATATSGNLTVNVNTALLKSFDLTGYPSTLSGGSALNVYPASGTVVCKLVGTISLTGYIYLAPASGATINFTPVASTGSYSLFIFDYGTVNLQANLSLSYDISLPYGTFNTNGYSIECRNFQGTGANVRALNLSSSTITCTGYFGIYNSTNMTFTCGTSTISAASLYGGGLTYNIVTLTGDNKDVQQSNTFATLNINNAGATTGLKFENGTTQTVTSNFTTNGSSGNLSKIISNSAGVHFHLVKSSGNRVSIDYMSIKDSYASGVMWYAGANSTNVSGNDGWTFTTPPPPPPLQCINVI